nr:immunoglobulin light chain junction region [Macaca mulatta]MOX29511.1 immunoglobulin light chain junction region [Macaca mulatta]MOX29585.1 immunoglobulin light chain junction region [Macaca mulatta]MOX32238.1 immunoglobulin light chain junction region [Macaca mulatta]
DYYCQSYDSNSYMLF